MAGLSQAQAVATARAQERDACVEFIRDKIAEVEGMRRRQRITIAEARLLTRRLDAIADGITAGLHR